MGHQRVHVQDITLVDHWTKKIVDMSKIGPRKNLGIINRASEDGFAYCVIRSGAPRADIYFEHLVGLGRQAQWSGQFIGAQLRHDENGRRILDACAQAFSSEEQEARQ